MRPILLGLILVAACASARRGVPLVGPIELSSSAQQGRVLFMRHCNQCHPGGEAGTGTAINNKPIPRPVMTLQIRQAVLGTMPKFSQNELADNEVDQILDYVEELRKHPR